MSTGYGGTGEFPQADEFSQAGEAREPTEEELRAAYEAQIKQVRVEDVLLENVVTVLNLGMRRTGLMTGTEDERDPEQVRLAIESIRAHLPLIEQLAPSEVSQIREALSQLQLAFVKIGGQAAGAATGSGGRPEGEAQPGGQPSAKPGGQPGAKPGGEPGAKPGGEPSAEEGGQSDGKPEEGPAKRDEPGPAQASGRLWVPGR